MPPLAVTGITLEAGAGEQSLGALLLFLTNVGAILLSGLIVMAIYRVRLVAAADAVQPGGGRWASIIVVVAFVAALAVPLGASSRRISREAVRASEVNDVATDWARPSGWVIVAVDPQPGAMLVRAAGPLPAPPTRELREQLDAAGLGGVDVRLVLTPKEVVDLEASATHLP